MQYIYKSLNTINITSNTLSLLYCARVFGSSQIQRKTRRHLLFLHSSLLFFVPIRMIEDREASKHLYFSAWPEAKLISTTSTIHGDFFAFTLLASKLKSRVTITRFAAPYGERSVKRQLWEEKEVEMPLSDKQFIQIKHVISCTIVIRMNFNIKLICDLVHGRDCSFRSRRVLFEPAFSEKIFFIVFQRIPFLFYIHNNTE